MRFVRLVALVALGACGDDPREAMLDGGLDAAPAVEIDAGGELDSAVSSDAGEPDAGDPDAGFTGPPMLSATGLYEDIASRTLAAGVVEYVVQYELWSDGAEKRRFLSLPEGGVIDTGDPDRWRFPIGTRAWKEFHRDGVHVETRFLEKHEGGWTRIAYVWLEDGSDAVAVPEGLADARGTAHDVPSIDDCFNCHRGAGDELLGVSALQLADPSGTDLLESLAAEGRLSDVPASEPAVPGVGVVQESLGYLHANCGHCHNDDHPLSEHRSMRLYLPVGIATPEESPVYLTAIGTRANHTIEGTTTNIVAGDPDASQLFVRMRLRDENAMPPVGTEIEDPTGVEAIRAFIAALP